jgi:hypothetical protein
LEAKKRYFAANPSLQDRRKGSKGETAVKINKTYPYRLRNDTHFQFYTEFRNLVQKEGAENLKIAPQFEAWLPLYDKEDAALKHFSEEVRSAATRLKIVFDTYGEVVRKPLNEQSAPQNETAEAP